MGQDALYDDAVYKNCQIIQGLYMVVKMYQWKQ
jgi:hypothetical protein